MAQNNKWLKMHDTKDRLLFDPPLHKHIQCELFEWSVTSLGWNNTVFPNKVHVWEAFKL